ncbi:hypothetical protein SAMN05444166_4164 [Singulisphaera sp. GP187]|uniref:hypothetical protein n=1 Tax=Singulisphaera sp. GP187 TaxID=1882752 RepID=UPI000926F4A4|nr:hypothetical protein [Singulisphaera sp. GP187]SIO37080.1 hypothetical protein SAMN05444166_4164 [Singulisphaera sp. GP187]
MSAKLSTPLSRHHRQGPVVWQTVEKNGRKYTLQVYIDQHSLNEKVAEVIDGMEEFCASVRSLKTPELKIDITRML